MVCAGFTVTVTCVNEHATTATRVACGVCGVFVLVCYLKLERPLHRERGVQARRSAM